MNRTEYPTAFYAAAGAGDVAFKQLRKLPEVAARTADTMRERFAARDLSEVRESAQRGTTVLLARAAQLQERAAASYQRLVARGEQIVAERNGVATGHAEPASIEVEVGPVQSAEPASDEPDKGSGSAA